MEYTGRKGAFCNAIEESMKLGHSKAALDLILIHALYVSVSVFVCWVILYRLFAI